MQEAPVWSPEPRRQPARLYPLSKTECGQDREGAEGAQSFLLCYLPLASLHRTRGSLIPNNC